MRWPPCMGSGVVCARQKWVVCARQKWVVCARYLCVILWLYLCSMILLVAVFLFTSTHNSSLCGFLPHNSVCFLFLGLHSAPSPPSPPPLFLFSQPHPVLSHNAHDSLSSHNLHNSSHTAHLSQLNSHRSFYSTHLTQLNSVKSCFRVAFGGAAFVSSHRTSSKFFHTTHLITHSTHLTQLLSSHNSHNSTHSRAAFTYRYCTPPNWPDPTHTRPCIRAHCASTL